MKKYLVYLNVFLLLALLLSGTRSVTEATVPETGKPVMESPDDENETFVQVPATEHVTEALQSAPLMFIENVGQFDDEARFQLRGANGTIWLTEDGLWVTVLEQLDRETRGQRDQQAFSGSPPHLASSSPQRGVNLKLSFPDANPQPRLEPFNRLETSVNYFLGNDPAQWQTNVPVWGGVRYKDLYPGIDLEITSERGRMVQRVVARPGADLNAVRLRVEGADEIALDGDHLRLTTAVGEFSLPLLTVEGTVPDGQPETFNVESDTFEVTAPFSLFPPLPIAASSQDNPSDLLYATFLGGGYSNGGSGIAVDGSGAAYVTGDTVSSDFPTTPGAFDPTYNGGSYDAFVVKLNPSGSALTYATFLGGGGGDHGKGIAVDAGGAAYVTGYTGSSDFPTTPGALDRTYDGSYTDVFVVKLNPAGSDLSYATFLGGEYWDYGQGIAVDGGDHAYVMGNTRSLNFPTSPGAFDRTHNGGSYDAFMVKLNPSGSALAYATFLGGGDYDAGKAIAVDGSGAAYITGYTESSDFPTTPGAFDRTHNGGGSFNAYDAFVVKLNSTGSDLIYSTFLGGRDSDGGRGIAVDGSGHAYVTGITDSSRFSFPITPEAYDTFSNGGGDGFVVKFDPTGSDLIYSTFLGGILEDCVYSVAVDRSGAAYVTGDTGSIDFPVTPGAFATIHNGEWDTFVAKLDPSGSELTYATFLGGSNTDHSYAIAVDEVGNAYVTGETECADFPTTPGAFEPTHNGYSDAFVVKLGMGGGATGSISGRVTGTTSDLGLSNVIVTAQTYSTTTDLNGNYSLDVSPGVYQVKATPNAGMDYYANQRSFITVDNGESVTVDLKLSPIISDTVDTLILANLQRMKEIGYDAGAVNELETKIGELQSTHPDDSNMTAIFTDLGESVSPEIDAAYTAWDGNEGDVTKTNDLVDSIDAYIESLKQGDYPNLEYVIIVGSHEVIPMKARAADSGEENEWAEELPVHSGYLYEIYKSQEDGASGHYLTDSQYSDLSFIDNGDTRGCDGELVPEIHVGRLIETPSQILGLVDAYLSTQGILSRNKMVSIASVDLLDSGTIAAEYMGGTADDDLVQGCFQSNSLVEKLETGPDIVYLAGHSSYNLIGTCRSFGNWNQVFYAGPSDTQGSIQDITIDLTSSVIASVGCHNGLNLGNQRYQAPNGESKWSDFPEEFAAKKVGVFLASTGYAPISGSWYIHYPGAISHSEKLMTNFLYFLLHEHGSSVGESFKKAIDSYVTHNEECGDLQNRVLAISTLYGFPNYKLPISGNTTLMNNRDQFLIATFEESATSNNWPINMEISSWTLDESGMVVIPSASYMERINTPILPVISLSRLLPTGSSITNVSWNQDESESITMTNNVPLPVIGMPAIGTGENITITGTFTHTGDYPELPYFTTDISDVGGGRWINLQVVPVQYNQTTHITRIWTRLSFDVEYDIASSVDSDGDGLPDYWEKAYGLDPLNDSGDSGSDADVDGDGLTNAEEYSYSTNPTSADTDDDGVQDQTEIVVGTDPNNPFSKADLVFLPIVTRNY